MKKKTLMLIKLNNWVFVQILPCDALCFDPIRGSQDYKDTVSALSHVRKRCQFLCPKYFLICDHHR